MLQPYLCHFFLQCSQTLIPFAQPGHITRPLLIFTQLLIQIAYLDEEARCLMIVFTASDVEDSLTTKIVLPQPVVPLAHKFANVFFSYGWNGSHGLVASFMC